MDTPGSTPRATYGPGGSETISDAPSSASSAPSSSSSAGARRVESGDGIEYSDGVTHSSWPNTTPDSRPATSERPPGSRRLHLPYASTDVKVRIGSYDVLEELGRGGMGTVHRAYSLKLSRFVALKVFTPRRAATEIDVVRFRNEVMLAGRLKHPNVVTVYDSGEEGGKIFFAMDYVDGGSLGEYIREAGGPKDATHAKKTGKELPKELVPIIIKVARALDFAHQKGVIHRDIKPDNILLGRDLEPFISDFGLAKMTAEAHDLTRDGKALGTPFYMPPEQANGELAHVGPRSDVYSLGATLYHLLTGAPPFNAPTELLLLASITHKEPVHPVKMAKQTLDRDLPPDLATICLKAMEKEASRRYESAAALADDLQRFLEGDVIRARPAGFVERAQKTLRRRRGLMTGVLATALVLATLVAAFGVLTVDSVTRSSRSLVEFGYQDALQQAATVERAIRVNMLEGRADQARLLLQQLAMTEGAGQIQVLRTDRQLAYTDMETRDKVKANLASEKVLERIRTEFPEMLPTIEMLKSAAFPNIEHNPQSPQLVEVDRKAWREALLTGKPQHYDEVTPSGTSTVVLWPIENSAQCRVCHSSPEQDSYGYDPIRAVVVVKRSQEDVLRVVRDNRNATLRIGAIAAAALVGLMIFFYKVLGMRPRGERFGVVERRGKAP